MEKLKKSIFKGTIMMTLLMSMVITVCAQTETATMSYGGTTVKNSLICTWKVGTDSAYATTVLKSGSSYSNFGAGIFGYDKKGALTASKSNTGSGSVTSGTISCTASKFKSSHSILNSSGTVVKRVYITVTD